MVHSKEENSIRDGSINGLNPENQQIDDSLEDSSEGLRNMVREDEELELDLLLQQSDREENVLQFLQALDLQVIGACRADERLIPLLKTNVSNCASEDRFLAHLIQHFEAQEIGMLARCLCLPLVSIGVGRITKQGNLLCPTSVRGKLNISLLPSSNLRITFTGDDGCSERLVTLSGSCKNSTAIIEEIPADTSGRSFVLKMLSSQVYFWCSEKSKLLGNELLMKMKDLLERKPSLAELTGISELRLASFAVHLREYLLGSSVNSTQTVQIVTPVTSLDMASEPSVLDSSIQISTSFTKLSIAPHSGKSPEAPAHAVTEGFDFASTPMMTVVNISLCDNKNPSDASIFSSSSLGFLESRGNLASLSSFNQLVQELPSVKDLAGGSCFFPPSYCSCPPCTSTLQGGAEIPLNDTISFSDSFSLPPLSSLLPANRSLNPFVPLKTPHNLVDVSSLDLLLSDPVIHLPLSISLATVSSSQQVPTFTPLICDPIVHIPAIGVCSSGQGYLVGAGHGPSIPDSEAMVEKGARETLQLLLSSAQANPWSRDVLPTVLTSAADILEHSRLDAGCHNQFSEISDVEAFANGFGTIDFGSLQHQRDLKRRHGGDLGSGNQSEGAEGLKSARSDDLNNDHVG